MSNGTLTPAQEKFFTAHINKGLLGRIRQKKDQEFEAAFKAYRDAEATAAALLTNLPMYPKGSLELAEKDSLIDRFSKIAPKALAPTRSQSAAIAACQNGKAEHEEVIQGARRLMDKALSDLAVPAPERITLLKQGAALHLNQTRDAFDAKAQPVIAEMAASAGANVRLPVAVAFETGLAALYAKVSAIPADGANAESATASVQGIAADADRLLAKSLAELESFAGSDDMAQVIELGKRDAALRDALSAAKTNVRDMIIWGIPDGKAMETRLASLTKRGDVLFGQNAFERKTAAASAIAARTDLQADIERLNLAAIRAIQDKKEAFRHLLDDVNDRFSVVLHDFRNIDDKNFAGGQKPYVEDVLAMTRTAINDLNGYNTNALIAAKSLVDHAAVVVAAAEKGAETNARLMAELTDMGATIARGRQKGKPLSARFDALAKELDDLSRDWPDMLILDATHAVQAFQTRLTAAVQLSEALEARRDTARNALAAAQAELVQFDVAYGKMLKSQGQKVKPYAGSLVDDLSNIELWIGTKTALSFYDTIDAMLVRVRATLSELNAGLLATEGKSDEAIFAEALALQRQLDEVAQEAMLGVTAKGEAPDLAALANARASVGAQIDQLATRRDLLAEANAADRQKAEEAAQKDAYLAEARAYIKMTKAALKTAEIGTGFAQYKDDVTGHLSRIEASIKQVEKGGPARPALSELAFLRQTIDGIAARGAKTDVNKLYEIGREWADAVSGFEAKCAEMRTAVEGYLKANQLGAEYAASVTALDAALTALQTRMEPAAFVRAGNRFRDPAQFKSAREEALQKVRYFNDLLLNDPIVHQCVLNPFGVRDFASPLASRLRQIELNVLRAA